MTDPVPSQTLQDMMDYYRARANEYDEWFYRHGRYDRGAEGNARWFAEADEVFSALDALRNGGRCPGISCWHRHLDRAPHPHRKLDHDRRRLPRNDGHQPR